MFAICCCLPENDYPEKMSSHDENTLYYRAKFSPVKGKYTLIEMGEGDDDEPSTTSVGCTVLKRMWAGVSDRY